ncbi:MAG: ethanolamine utilization protein EutN, partial [Planctomycetota bacterium]
MQLARVIGHATATVKHPSLSGWKLLIVQMLGAQGDPDGDPQIAVDNLGSSAGDRVMVAADGSA